MVSPLRLQITHQNVTKYDIFRAAYFERSVDSMFGVVHRPEFESHMRSKPDNRQDEDPAWYALRNMVYASGCRLHHSVHYDASFSDIQEEAWGYFSNALLVHSELLLRRPSIQAIRALLAMVSTALGPHDDLNLMNQGSVCRGTL